MKKNLLLFCITLLLATTFRAQTYTYTKLNGTYTDITGGTIVSTSGWDYFSIVDTQLPFQFTFFGVVKDSLYLMPGFAAFHQNGAGNFDADQIYFYDAAQKERGIGGASHMSTVTVGTAPNRIYKLQTKNAAFDDDAVTDEDYSNAQLWLYEGTNVIEVHCGPASVKAATYFPLLGPTVGIYKDQISFLALSGPATNPSASSSMASLNVTGTPTNGTIYRFTPSPTGVNELNLKAGGLVYPNPSNGNINFKSNKNISDASIKVFNMMGQLVYEKNSVSLMNGKTINIDTQLLSGIYNVQLVTKDQTHTPIKLIIK